jgi:hypothetical protein
MTDEIIPTTYTSWRHCIENKCRQTLTRDYITGRLAALRDTDDAHTRSFIRLYGEKQRQATIAWFERAHSEISFEPVKPSGNC